MVTRLTPNTVPPARGPQPAGSDRTHPLEASGPDRLRFVVLGRMRIHHNGVELPVGPP